MTTPPQSPQRPWFDPNSGSLLFDEMVAERPSYQKITADGVVTYAEFHEQTTLVTSLFKALEASLTPEAKSAATDALCELAVLHALSARLHRKAGRP